MDKRRDISPFGLRMPSDLREKIARSAEIHGRSMNAEIVYRLENSFSEGKTIERLEKMERALREAGLMEGDQ